MERDRWTEDRKETGRVCGGREGLGETGRERQTGERESEGVGWMRGSGGASDGRCHNGFTVVFHLAKSNSRLAPAVIGPCCITHEATAA